MIQFVTVHNLYFCCLWVAEKCVNAGLNCNSRFNAITSDYFSKGTTFFISLNITKKNPIRALQNKTTIFIIQTARLFLVTSCTLRRGKLAQQVTKCFSQKVMATVQRQYHKLMGPHHQHMYGSRRTYSFQLVRSVPTPWTSHHASNTISKNSLATVKPIRFALTKHLLTATL